MKQILVRFLLVSIAILVVACTSTQKHEPDLIKLTTISNMSGTIGQMRDDGLFLIVDNGAQGKYLVDVRAGSILYQADESESLRIDPGGDYAWYFGFGIGHKVIDLETGMVFDSTDELPPPDKDYYVLRTEAEGETLPQTSVIETSTGKEVFHIEGYQWVTFGPEQHYLIITEPDSTPPEVYLLDLARGELKHTFVAPRDVPDGAMGWTIAPYFTEQNDLFFIYWGFLNTTQIFDAETDELEYEFTGGVQISPDRRLLIANNNEGYSDVQAFDLSTGELLYEVNGGAIYPSITGRYLYIKAGYDVADVQVIDTASDEVVYEARGWLSQQFLKNDTQLTIWNVLERVQQIIDLDTGNVVYEFEKGQELSYFNCHPYYIIQEMDDPYTVALVEESFENALLTASQIEFSPDCNLIFASDGTSIDVYGRLELQGLFD